MMKKRSDFKNLYLLSISGAVLILLSTFVTGYMAFKKENEMSDINLRISDLTNQITESKFEVRDASIEGDLSFVQRTVVKYSLFQDPEIQGNWHKAYIASLYTQVLKYRKASGKSIDEAFVREVNNLKERAVNGDKSAFSELNEIIISNVEDTGHYLGDLHIQREFFTEKKSEAEKWIIGYKYVGIFLQLIGLMLMLSREIIEKGNK